jgi:hypothetical protein
MVVKVKVEQYTSSLIKDIRVPLMNTNTDSGYPLVKFFPDIFDDPRPSTNTYNN